MCDCAKVLALVLALLFTFGCTQTTVYWSKTGSGTSELLEDKEVCQSLQRSVGLNEERIEKCLEAQGWTPVRQEIQSSEVDDEGPDAANDES